ncbi:ABC transporter ATP-binding protein [Neoasaia chiangmaiensis NBRC 101099]|uniref:ABC transporter ATP-binding protein n=1 Tax=Neoasaia chiangmaiensis TaxID=320497 RepID=UPI00119317A4|nr:ATP-binding cassette domain-containing protein [Neoasaia chiangmaiensis]GBR39308.1 ABC transporter ATP-binding protein [Neoasaia chiangmaiensis NBRC 101099]GEN14517.1 ABC transporter ATP-binding protein [Neoasaia chiangmaiensis]
MPSHPTAIDVENLRKTYRIREGGGWRGKTREITALDGISFSVPAGEIAGFIGPNGAGKSTAIKILSGILRPSSGMVRVGNLVPWRDRIAHVARIGVVFGQRTQLWWDLSVAEGLKLLGDIYNVEPARFARNKARLAEALDLGGIMDQSVRQLSLGQRMRAEIAAALLHDPEVLILDEPTIGLDAPSKLAVRAFVRSLRDERGTTVLLTTHDMHDIEALAERVIVIGHGRILADSPFEALRATTLSERILEADFAETPPPLTLPEGATETQRSPRSVTITFDPRRIPAPALVAHLNTLPGLDDLRIGRPAIEEIITRFYADHAS